MSEETARAFGIDPATLPPAALATLTCRTAFFATSFETASRWRQVDVYSGRRSSSTIGRYSPRRT